MGQEPRRGESLGSYLRRTRPASPSPPPPSPAEPSPFPGVSPRDRAAESWRRFGNRPLVPVRPPRVRTYRDLRSFMREPPEEYSGPTSMNLNEIPQSLDPTLREPRRGLGLIHWGADGRRPVPDVLADVETVSGAPRGLLAAIGYRESAGDSRAKNESSSAQGPFQFIDSTWRQWARGALPIYGLPPSMADEEMFWQREDWTMAGAAVAELARYHDGELRRAMPDRAVSFADLYMMHFSYNSLAMMRDLANGRPRALAKDYFDAGEIASNPALRLNLTPQQFYDHMTRAGRSDALSREPVRFGARLDGSTGRFVPESPGGPLHLEE